MSLNLSADVTVLQLQQALATAKDKATAAGAALKTLKAEPARRADRRTEVPTLVLNAKKRLSDVVAALTASPPPPDPPELILARLTAHAAQKIAIEQEIALLEAELPAYDTTVELIALQEQAAEITASRAAKLVAKLQALLEEQRAHDAARQAEMARRSAVKAHPAVKPLAEENAQLAKRRTVPDGLTTKIATTTDSIEATQKLLEKLTNDRSDIEEKLKLPGMSSQVAPLLRQERSQLPRVRDLRRQIYQRNEEIGMTRFAQSEIKKRDQELVDTDDELASLEDSLPPSMDEQQQADVIEAARKLLQQRRQLLKDLQTDYTSYFNGLIDLNSEQGKLIVATEEMLLLLDHDMLWKQATAPITVAQIRSGADAIPAMFEVEKWNDVADDVRAAIVNEPLRTGLGCVLFVVLLATRGRTRRELRRLGDSAAASYLVPYHTTLKALGLTIVLTLLWPAVVMAVGWCLYADLSAAETSRAVGAGLLYMSAFYVSIEFWRMLCSRGGLAEAHFHWRTQRVRLIRRHLAWMGLLGLPLLTTVSAMAWLGAADEQADLARILSVIGLAAAAFFMQRTLRPLKSSAKKVAAESPGWVARSVYWFSIGVPLFCACLMALGYGFTARELCERLLQSVWLGTTLVVFQGLALRWLRLVRGKLALEQARERRPAPQESNSEREPEGDGDTDRRTSQDAALAAAATEADLETINLHTRHLLQVCLAVGVLMGIWLIWLDVLPGVDFLEFSLWSTPIQVVETVTLPDGTKVSQTVPRNQDVTIANVVLMLLVCCVALVASRNMPVHAMR